MITLATKLFELLGTITVNNSDANTKVDETSGKVNDFHGKFKDGLEKAGKWGLSIAAAAATAAAGIVKGITDIVNSTVQQGDEIDKASQRMGLSRESYQEWAYVLGQCGAEIGNLEIGMKTLVTQMEAAADPNSDAAKMFNELGVAVRNTDGSLRSTEEVFNETVLALTAMEDGTDKARIANTLFGRSGQDLMPVINGTAEEIVGLKNRAHELGLIMSDESVDAAVRLGDTMDDTKQAYSTFRREIGEALMPAFQELNDFLLEIYPTLKEMLVNDVLPAIQEALTKLKGVFEWFVTNGVSITTVFKQIGDAILVAVSATHPWVAALVMAAETIDRLTGGNKEEKVEDITAADHVYNAIIPGAGIHQLGNAMRNSALKPTEDATTEYGGRGGKFGTIDSYSLRFQDALDNVFDKYMLKRPDFVKDGAANNNQIITGSVVLDSGALVGYLMPAIDSKLGQLVAKKARG